MVTQNTTERPSLLLDEVIDGASELSYEMQIGLLLVAKSMVFARNKERELLTAQLRDGGQWEE